MNTKRPQSGYQTIVHPLQPFYDDRSRVLILGSFPSVKTREMRFFYGHPQNRFWPLLARLFHDEAPPDAAGRADFLRRHRIACWDVIYSCDIIGSSDASIRNVVPTDLTTILETAPIRAIFANGQTSRRLFARYHEPRLGRRAIVLPSTSPANAAWSLDRLADAWKIVAEAAADDA